MVRLVGIFTGHRPSTCPRGVLRARAAPAIPGSGERRDHARTDLAKSLTLVDLLREGLRPGPPEEAKARRLFALRALMAPAVAVEWANHLADVHARVGAPPPPGP